MLVIGRDFERLHVSMHALIQGYTGRYAGRIPRCRVETLSIGLGVF
jgi:hypothetical protein